MKTTDLPESTCPACGRVNDAATSVSNPDATPSEGDLCICFGCSAFLAYARDFSLRLLTLQEIEQLPDDTRIEMQRARVALAVLRSLDAK